jgi:O-antigen ligase
LGNGTTGTLLDLDNLTLRGSSARNYLQNGDFSSGGDRWFSYNDFGHLAWHAKNLYLAIILDQGLLGLVAFFALNAFGMIRARRAAHQGDILAAGTVAVAAAWLTLGGVSTLVDVPRDTFLYFLMLLAVSSMHEVRSTAQNAQPRLNRDKTLRNLVSKL